MAEVVMRRMVEDAGLADLVEVDSAGTGEWHIGERADRRAASVLAGRGYDASLHRARQFELRWFDRRDLIVALDRGHLRTLRSWASHEHERARIHLLRSFDPALGDPTQPSALDIDDPYYEGMPEFVAVLEQIEAACAGLLDHVRAELDDATVSN
jgi:protein-tyrosine phosphatase